MNKKNKRRNNNLSNKLTNIALNILSIASRVEHSMSVSLKGLNLTLPQFNALWTLVAHYPNPIPLKQLTKGMVDKSSNTSRLVDKLEEKKLVERQFAPLDRRTVHIAITETGFALANQACEQLESSLEKQVSPSEKNETHEFINELKILRGIS